MIYQVVVIVVYGFGCCVFLVVYDFVNLMLSFIYQLVRCFLCPLCVHLFNCSTSSADVLGI